MAVDEEAAIGTDVDRFERERVLSVVDDRVRRAIVDRAPVITGRQVRVVVPRGSPASGERYERARDAERSPNTSERCADRPP